ncbi:MAG TPA: AMP-binding protein [Jatrophihabitans sp.]|jgi:fatty-acyl-CoA synthase|uniref:AMP-binding protein n=1 Tax=Jatrophihabitans sp. TaxID=1932789 RepID=UPI002EE3466D
MTIGLSIVERLAAQPGDRPLVFLDDELRPTHSTLGELRERADTVAGALRRRFGIGPGTRVCLLGRTSPDTIATLFGIWRAGATVTVLPVSRRANPGDLEATLARRVSAAHASLVVTDLATAATLGDLAVPVVDFQSLGHGSAGAPLAAPDPHDIALLQFTSGTTALPRAVAVTHAQLVTNSHSLFTSGELVPGDGFVTWLPLYHDMGMIMLTGAIVHGYTAYVMDTQTFGARPGAWLETISTYRAAATGAPNFAFGLAGYYLSLGRARYDLSSLRVAWNGAEPIDPMALDQFIATAAEHGLPATTMAPGYGLAEATLAVTVGLPHERYHTVTVDRLALEDGLAQHVEDGGPGRTFVDCGAPLADTSVSITDDDGNPLPDGQVGSVRVRGPGVVRQYWTPDGSPHPTEILDDQDRLITGDLGFCLDGRFFVCGRQKDMIIVAGRNLYPEDFEFTAERIPGVRLGNVMAFSLPDSEEMVVVAETNLRESGAQDLVRAVSDTLAAELSYTPHDVVLVAPGTLPKTSSGKKQRHLCREQYQDKALTVRASAQGQG